jgi:hypothetical protein
VVPDRRCGYSRSSGRRQGATTFTPPRKPGDPEIEALTAIFAYDDGIKVLHEGIQYLAERPEDEQGWLTAQPRAPFPVTVIWGVYDTVSPPRVASTSTPAYGQTSGSPSTVNARRR